MSEMAIVNYIVIFSMITLWLFMFYVERQAWDYEKKNSLMIVAVVGMLMSPVIAVIVAFPLFLLGVDVGY